MAEEGGAAGAGAKTSSKYFGVISHEAVSPVTHRQKAVPGLSWRFRPVPSVCPFEAHGFDLSLRQFRSITGIQICWGVAELLFLLCVPILLRFSFTF